KRDVGSGAGDLLPFSLPQLREQRDVGDLLRRDHSERHYRPRRVLNNLQGRHAAAAPSSRLAHHSPRTATSIGMSGSSKLTACDGRSKKRTSRAFCAATFLIRCVTPAGKCTSEPSAAVVALPSISRSTSPASTIANSSAPSE